MRCLPLKDGYMDVDKMSGLAEYSRNTLHEYVADAAESVFKDGKIKVPKRTTTTYCSYTGHSLVDVGSGDLDQRWEQWRGRPLPKLVEDGAKLVIRVHVAWPRAGEHMLGQRKVGRDNYGGRRTYKQLSSCKLHTVTA